MNETGAPPDGPQPGADDARWQRPPGDPPAPTADATAGPGGPPSGRAEPTAAGGEAAFRAAADATALPPDHAQWQRPDPTQSPPETGAPQPRDGTLAPAGSSPGAASPQSPPPDPSSSSSSSGQTTPPTTPSPSSGSPATPATIPAPPEAWVAPPPAGWVARPPAGWVAPPPAGWVARPPGSWDPPIAPTPPPGTWDPGLKPPPSTPAAWEPPPPGTVPWQGAPTPPAPWATPVPWPAQAPPGGPPQWTGPGEPAPFTSPPAKFPVWVVILLVVLSIVGYLAFNVINFVQAWHSVDGVALNDPIVVPYQPQPTITLPPPAEPEPSASEPPGPSTTPVRDDDDLARVCDGRYYPQSPRFAGKPPHQISVGVVDQLVEPSRYMLPAVDVPDLRESVWRAWIPRNAAKSQLVACVDLVRTGKKLKTCSFDKPTAERLPLEQGFYRLRLYETATGRKLMDRPSITGQDTDCPTGVFLIGSQGVYSQVSDRQLYDALKGYVMRQ